MFKKYNRLINLFLSSGERKCIYSKEEYIYSERKNISNRTFNLLKAFIILIVLLHFNLLSLIIEAITFFNLLIFVIILNESFCK